jgi:cyclopentanol dehydrogenase
MVKTYDRLTGKVAIITGGASGIGAATAEIFVAEGASVIIADIQDAAGMALAAKLGPKAAFVHVDVSVEADVINAVTEAKKRFGGLDVMVANAGVESTLREVDTSEELWSHIMNVNAKGTFFCSKHAIPAMLERGGGSIINVSSAFSHIGSVGYAAYHASKGAVCSFTKATAIAHAKENIRANSVHPGCIETPMMRSIIDHADDPAAAEIMYRDFQPIGRMGKPEEIAFGAVFLASDEGRFLTGSELVIDGGYIAR